jgi:hypothetical protein
MYEGSIVKPSKHCLKSREGRKWEYNGGVNLFNYIVCIYGTITMKPPHVNICQFKNFLENENIKMMEIIHCMSSDHHKIFKKYWKDTLKINIYN